MTELKPYYSIEEISNAITGLPTTVPDAIRANVIRYAIPIEFGGPLFRYLTDSLAPPLKDRITKIKSNASLKSVQKIHADASAFREHELMEDTLYLKHSNLGQCQSGREYFAHTLEIFDGRAANLWRSELATDQMWITMWLELTKLGKVVDLEDDWFNGLLADGLVSTKELVSVTGVRPSFPSGFGPHLRVKPFQLYNRQPNNACKAIHDWGNIYFEQKGSIPSVRELREFMRENQKNVVLSVELVKKQRGMDEIFHINGTRVTTRAFKDYYDRLTQK